MIVGEQMKLEFKLIRKNGTNITKEDIRRSAKILSYADDVLASIVVMGNEDMVMEIKKSIEKKFVKDNVVMI